MVRAYARKVGPRRLGVDKTREHLTDPRGRRPPQHLRFLDRLPQERGEHGRSTAPVCNHYTPDGGGSQRELGGAGRGGFGRGRLGSAISRRLHAGSGTAHIASLTAQASV